MVGVKKKLRAASTRKENEELQPWIKALGNHLWWSCMTCGGNEMVIFWFSISSWAM